MIVPDGNDAEDDDDVDDEYYDGDDHEVIDDGNKRSNPQRFVARFKLPRARKTGSRARQAQIRIRMR